MVARILRLDEVPTPADAADALALALCHAWRGGAAVRGIRPAHTGQRAWATRALAAGERACVSLEQTCERPVGSLHDLLRPRHAVHVDADSS
jgi:hypothetical protein